MFGIEAIDDAEHPLLEVRKGPFEVRNVQNIADILVDPEGALERRNHWEKTSHSLLARAVGAGTGDATRAAAPMAGGASASYHLACQALKTSVRAVLGNENPARSPIAITVIGIASCSPRA